MLNYCFNNIFTDIMLWTYFFMERDRYEGCDKEQEKDSARRVVDGQHQKREGREQKKHREIKGGHAKDLFHVSLLRYLKLKNESYIFLFFAYTILSWFVLVVT